MNNQKRTNTGNTLSKEELATRFSALIALAEKHELYSQADSVRQQLLDLDEPLFIMVVGKGNFGKSTLLNALVGAKVAAISKRPKTWKVDIYERTENQEYAELLWETKRESPEKCTLEAAREICEEQEQTAKSKKRNKEYWKSELIQAKWFRNLEWPLSPHVLFVDTPGFAQERSDVQVETFYLYGSKGFELSSKDPFETYYNRSEVVLWCIKSTNLEDEFTRESLEQVNQRYQSKKIVGILTFGDRVSQEQRPKVFERAKELYGEWIQTFVMVAGEGEEKESSIIRLRNELQKEYINNAINHKIEQKSKQLHNEAQELLLPLDVVMEASAQNIKLYEDKLSSGLRRLQTRFEEGRKQITKTWTKATKTACSQLNSLWEQSEQNAEKFQRLVETKSFKMSLLTNENNKVLHDTLQELHTQCLRVFEQTQWEGAKVGLNSHTISFTKSTNLTKELIIKKQEEFSVTFSGGGMEAGLIGGAAGVFIGSLLLGPLGAVVGGAVAAVLFGGQTRKKEILQEAKSSLTEFGSKQQEMQIKRLEGVYKEYELLLKEGLQSSFQSHHGQNITQLIKRARALDQDLRELGIWPDNRKTIPLPRAPHLMGCYEPMLARFSKEVAQTWRKQIDQEIERIISEHFSAAQREVKAWKQGGETALKQLQAKAEHFDYRKNKELKAWTEENLRSHPRLAQNLDRWKDWLTSKHKTYYVHKRNTLHKDLSRHGRELQIKWDSMIEDLSQLCAIIDFEHWLAQTSDAQIEERFLRGRYLKAVEETIEMFRTVQEQKVKITASELLNQSSFTNYFLPLQPQVKEPFLQSVSSVLSIQEDPIKSKKINEDNIEKLNATLSLRDSLSDPLITEQLSLNKHKGSKSIIAAGTFFFFVFLYGITTDIAFLSVLPLSIYCAYAIYSIEKQKSRNNKKQAKYAISLYINAIKLHFREKLAQELKNINRKYDIDEQKLRHILPQFHLQKLPTKQVKPTSSREKLPISALVLAVLCSIIIYLSATSAQSIYQWFSHHLPSQVQQSNQDDDVDSDDINDKGDRLLYRIPTKKVLPQPKKKTGSLKDSRKQVLASPPELRMRKPPAKPVEPPILKESKRLQKECAAQQLIQFWKEPSKSEWKQRKPKKITKEISFIEIYKKKANILCLFKFTKSLLGSDTRVSLMFFFSDKGKLLLTKEKKGGSTLYIRYHKQEPISAFRVSFKEKNKSPTSANKLPSSELQKQQKKYKLTLQNLCEIKTLPVNLPALVHCKQPKAATDCTGTYRVRVNAFEVQNKQPNGKDWDYGSKWSSKPDVLVWLKVGNTKIVTSRKRNSFAATFNGEGRFVTIKKSTTVMLKVYDQERWGRKQLMGKATLNDVCVAIKANEKYTFSNFGSVKKVVVLFQKTNLLRRPPQLSKQLKRFVFNNQKVRKLIFAWKHAWEKTALRKSWAYELFYHPKFYDPIKNRDKAGHVGYKMKVGKKLRWIYLHISKLRWKETHSPHLLKVTFRQFYACPRLRDRGTKTMLWKKHNGRWKIISERWRKQ